MTPKMLELKKTLPEDLRKKVDRILKRFQRSDNFLGHNEGREVYALRAEGRLYMKADGRWTIEGVRQVLLCNPDFRGWSPNTTTIIREAKGLVMLGLLSAEDEARLGVWYQEQVEKKWKEEEVDRIRKLAADLGYSLVKNEFFDE